jgi:hypothetical protein
MLISKEEEYMGKRDGVVIWGTTGVTSTTL